MSLKTHGGARLTNAEQKFTQTALEYLAASKGDKLSPIHTLFEDAIKNGYTEKINDVLSESISKAKSENILISEALRQVLEKRGISENDLLNCKKG